MKIAFISLVGIVVFGSVWAVQMVTTEPVMPDIGRPEAPTVKFLRKCTVFEAEKIIRCGTPDTFRVFRFADQGTVLADAEIPFAVCRMNDGPFFLPRASDMMCHEGDDPSYQD